jgi:uncharacterized protein
MDTLNVSQVSAHKPFRKMLFVLCILINLFLIVLSGYYITATKKLARDPGQYPKNITVSGEGKVLARPDIATFTATVITENARIAIAQEENTTRSNGVIEYIKANGVAEKDIKTTSYAVNPQYSYEDYSDVRCFSYPCPPISKSPPKITSYRVHHMIEIKVRDLSKADDLLQGVVDNGANDVGSLFFDIDNKDALNAEARKKAIEDAKKKAGVLAHDLGVRLISIEGFSEGGGYYPIYARSTAEGFGGDAMVPPKAAPVVEEGQQEIHANITITYRFK